MFWALIFSFFKFTFLIFSQNTNYFFWSLFWSFDFQKWVRVVDSGFAFFTKIKIFRNCTFITNTDNRVHFAAITSYMFVNGFLFFFEFGRSFVFFYQLNNFWNHFSDLCLDHTFHEFFFSIHKWHFLVFFRRD